jgi:hypothetical protein
MDVHIIRSEIQLQKYMTYGTCIKFCCNKAVIIPSEGHFLDIVDKKRDVEITCVQFSLLPSLITTSSAKEDYY